MADIHVPKLNNNDTEYLIVEWLVGNGKPVIAGEPIAVLETSKATDELEAGETGYLHHAAALGTLIAPGALLARITAEAAPPPAPVSDAPEPVASEDASGQEDAPVAEPVVTAPARAAMEELGVSHAEVASLGLAVIRRTDVEALASRRTGRTAADVREDAREDVREDVQGDVRGDVRESAPEVVPGDVLEDVPEPVAVAGAHRLSRVQRAVARAVTTSHGTIPAAYTVVRFEVGPLLERARGLSREVRRPVGLAELFVQAVAALHPAFPLFFASLDGDRARPADAPRVGVTFDMGEGLYVPVVHDTGSLKAIADALMRYRLAATEGDFREKDLTGANIAVTLHTDADVILAIPLIFPGTVCALAITSPQPELVLAEDGTVAARTVANIGLAYDHRLINGRDAALFLAALRMELHA
ncbi:2-oxo acid dehydrogenase subunit E2 [Streptosporangium sp. NBC_01495]|uniref:2-oxo acid dehydrogenase subunit E2 n=1 Tax=Streptosporangium sp. NBC_01495 TaxID=2903899 RepID=UPI002E37F7CE|nr:2-oxo acid dehydrogenase subunit E2 [Streptosporangium sp. NBC_01495]